MLSVSGRENESLHYLGLVAAQAPGHVGRALLGIRWKDQPLVRNAVVFQELVGGEVHLLAELPQGSGCVYEDSVPVFLADKAHLLHWQPK